LQNRRRFAIDWNGLCTVEREHPTLASEDSEMVEKNQRNDSPDTADLPGAGRLRGTTPLRSDWPRGYDEAARHGEPADAWPGWPDVTQGGGTAQRGYRMPDEDGVSYSAFTAGGRHWTQGGYDEQGGGYGPEYYGGRPRGPKGYKRADERIREDICELLTRRHDLDVGDVTVDVEDGHVVLEGTVSERRMKHAIEDIAAATLGVVDVDNWISVA
jgi:hypothetical protein